jgi:hypothetical protein
MRALDSQSTCDAVPALAVLHGLRLKGFVDTASLADGVALVGVSADPADLVPTLADLATAGFVRCVGGDRDGGPNGNSLPNQTRRWGLTEAGRTHHEHLLADQLDATDGRAIVELAFGDFLVLNPRLLDVCTRWQVRDLEASLINDHTDPDYDAAVVEALAAIDAEAQPILARLAAVLERFAQYGPALAGALAKVESGQTDWFARPTIASYHTLWFELHEDLLATLGLERASKSTGSTVG